MTGERFYALDGLKGFAILAVVFTHIPLDVWFKFIPSEYGWLFAPLVGGGGIGVAIFFILTGFLMGYLYPTIGSKVTFYSRRYSRLFPAFLVMTVSLTIFEIVKLSVIYQVIVLLTVMLCASFLIKIYPKINDFVLAGRGIIYWVFLVQIVVALWYVFFLLKVPAPVYYHEWSPLAQSLVVFAVNSTMTLPFGGYIKQLDGVYYALCVEMFFYILYPIIVLPLIVLINKRFDYKSKILLFISLFPFCYGLNLIGKNILGFGLLQLHLFVYLFIGVFIGSNVDGIRSKFRKFQYVFATWYVILFLILVSFGSVIINSFLSDTYRLWLLILSVIPIGLLLIVVISADRKKKTFLESPFLVFFGKYSYAIFLSHSFVIHAVNKSLSLKSSTDGVIVIILCLIGTVIIGWFLHFFTEKPYFDSRKKSETNVSQGVENDNKWMNFRIIAFVVFMVFVSYLAYRPNIPLFTLAYRNYDLGWFRASVDTVLLGEAPIVEKFTARENYLGMYVNHIKVEQIPGVVGGFTPFRLRIRLSDQSNNVVSESMYDAWEIRDALHFPFGFPIQGNSKGKDYSVEFMLSQKSLSQELKIVRNEPSMSVYFVDKKTIFTNPKVFASWFLHKLSEPFSNIWYWHTMLLIAPFIFIVLLYVLKNGGKENAKFQLRQ